MLGPDAAVAQTPNALGVWNPLDERRSDESEGHAVSAQIGITLATDIDDPLRLVRGHVDPTARSEGGTRHVVASTRASLGYQPDRDWQLAVFHRIEAHASAPAATARGVWQILADRAAGYRDLSGWLQAERWSGRGVRLSRLVDTQWSAARVTLAGSLSLMELADWFDVRAAGVAIDRPDTGELRRLDLAGVVARSDSRLAFGPPGDRTGWGWTGDLAVRIEPEPRSRFDLVLNDVAGRLMWERMPVTTYRIQYRDPAELGCCLPTRDPTLTFAGELRNVARAPLTKWQAAASHDAGPLTIMAALSGAGALQVPSVGVALPIGTSRLAFDYEARFSSLGAGWRSGALSVGVRARPYRSGEGGALGASLGWMTIW